LAGGTNGDYIFSTSLTNCVDIDLEQFIGEGPGPGGPEVFMDKLIKKALAAANPFVVLQVPNNGNTGSNKTLTITLTNLNNAVLGPNPTYTLNIVANPTSGGGGYIPTSGGTPPAPGVYCAPLLTKYIKLYSINDPDQVRRLEQFLNDFEGERLNVNGIYGLEDFEAVKRFQAKYLPEVINAWEGLEGPTGYVYISTENAINAIYCSRPIPPLFFPRTGGVPSVVVSPSAEENELNKIGEEIFGGQTPAGGEVVPPSGGEVPPAGEVTPGVIHLTPEQIAQQQQEQGIVPTTPGITPTGGENPSVTPPAAPSGFRGAIVRFIEAIFNFFFNLFGGNR
jgi:hypothetical protein